MAQKRLFVLHIHILKYSLPAIGGHREILFRILPDISVLRALKNVQLAMEHRMIAAQRAT